MHASARMISMGMLAIPLTLVADAQMDSRDQVELIDGESIAGRVVEFRRDVVLVDRRTVPVERIVRWDRFATARKEGAGRGHGADEVLLVGGDRLRCRVQTIDLECVVARWDLLASPTVFRVPLEHVRAVMFSPRTAARLGRRPNVDRGGLSADELLLRGGDRLVGELKSVGADMVELTTAVGPRRVARQSVATLLVNSDLQVMVQRPKRHVRIAFSDGSRLTATRPISDENRLIGLEFPGIETVGAAVSSKARVDVPLPVNRSFPRTASTRTLELPATDPALFRYPVVFMHGRNRFDFSAGETKQLRTYLNNGGLLFADAICGARPFDKSFRRMIGQLYPDAKLERIPADHEMFRLELGYDIRRVKRRVVPAGGAGNKALATEIHEGQPMLEGLRVDGRYVVIYSRHDLSCALQRQSSVACPGYVTRDAVRIGVNVILYAMIQDAVHRQRFQDLGRITALRRRLFARNR